MRPELDNHWALRDFAARLMAQICKNFNTSTNNLQTRVTRLFSSALQNEKTQLSSLYGAVAGLSELGAEVIKVFIVPRLRFVSDRIEPQLQGSTISNTDKIAAGHIRAMLQKMCAPVLKTMRNAPDIVDEYKRDFGFLGLTLHQAVVKARNAPPSATTATSSVSAGASSSGGPTSSTGPSSSVAQSGGGASETPRTYGGAGSSAINTVGGSLGRVVVSGATIGGVAKTITMPPGNVVRQTGATTTIVPAALPPQKFVLVQNPSSTTTTPQSTIVGANTTIGSTPTQPMSMPTASNSNVSG